MVKNICINVFHFDKLVTSNVSVECAKKSLRPDTSISLMTITRAGYTKTPCITVFETRIKITKKILDNQNLEKLVKKRINVTRSILNLNNITQ